MKACAALCLAAFLLGAAPARAGSAPLLYRVRDGEGHTLYLLGTIHMGREDFYPLDRTAEDAYLAADVLAVEADVYALSGDARQSAQYSRALTYPSGDTAEAHLSPAAYSLGVSRLGQPAAALNRLRPAAWAALAEQRLFAGMGCSGEQGTDVYLLTRAHSDGKEILELEGWEKQLALMLEIPDAVYDALLLAHWEDGESARALLLSLLNAWQSGDEQALNGWFLEELRAPAGLPEEMFDAYNERMYFDRNHAFARQAEACLSSGKTALFAIGAAHLLGGEGVPALLRQAGYTIEARSGENLWTP